jgi:hypothetical protein
LEKSIFEASEQAAQPLLSAVELIQQFTEFKLPGRKLTEISNTRNPFRISFSEKKHRKPTGLPDQKFVVKSSDSA